MRVEAYSPTERDRWRDLLANEAQQRHVYAFAKHEGIPTTDDRGGVGLAQWLVEHA
jgi:hypothetical protein